MRSLVFPAAAAAPRQPDEEEAAALVPVPEEDGRRHQPARSKEEEAAVVVHAAADDDDLPAAASEQRQPPPPSPAKPAPARWASSSLTAIYIVRPTRGAGLAVAGLLFLALLAGTCRSSGRSWPWIRLDGSNYYYYPSAFLFGGGSGGGSGSGSPRRPPHHAPSSAADLVPIPLSCAGNETYPPSSPLSPGTCRRRLHQTTSPSPSPSPSPSAAQPATAPTAPSSPPPRCPDYFRFIHSDLSPWRASGITRAAVERVRDRAAFRLVVSGGRAFVETYHRVFQTRDSFTLWGVAQLLARYPGRVPDLDLMFNCEDMPEVRAADFPAPSEAPPLFRYCKDESTLDVVFPDWSFWGWPEVGIRPWAPLLEEMAAEARRLPWPERRPYAHWRGNPGVSQQRAELLRCNVSEGTEWNARVFRQDWDAAAAAGFPPDGASNLARQCDYRYKIFVQGRSWSVSEKYILACDSPTLLVATPYEDFFSRGLVAGEHYWPIDPADKCAAVRFAVDWGNAHPAAARRMAEAGSGFARDEVSMDYVYDYMLHLLTEYARLLRYTPTVPENAVELCPEALACAARGRERQFMMESRESHVAGYEPCALPPPFTDDELRDRKRHDEEVRRKVRKMTQEAKRR